MAWICCACARAEGTRNSTYRIKALIAASRPLRVAAQLPRCSSMWARKSRISAVSICSRQIWEGLTPRRLLAKMKQEPKGISIGLARVRAAPLLDRHVFAQEVGYQRGDGCHKSSLAMSASAAAAMSIINSGVASRYQKV